MKAMILAAGLGLRMRPLTLLRAKPSVPVLNRPLLLWTLDRLARDGVRDVMINLHHLPRTVRGVVGDGLRLGLRVYYSHEPRILGTGGGPKRVRGWLGDETALLVNGDVLFDFDLCALVRRHRESGALATLALKAHPRVRHYGAVVTDARGWIRSIAGAPTAHRGAASVFTGVHVIEPALLDRLPQGVSDSVRDLYVPLLAEGERLLGVRQRGAWYDFGSPSAYLTSQLSMLVSLRRRSPSSALIDPSAVVSSGARVKRSIVGPGCIIGAGARIVGSVMWEGARVGSGARVTGSILGSDARVPERGRVVREVWAAGRAVRLS